MRIVGTIPGSIWFLWVLALSLLVWDAGRLLSLHPVSGIVRDLSVVSKRSTDTNAKTLRARIEPTTSIGGDVLFANSQTGFRSGYLVLRRIEPGSEVRCWRIGESDSYLLERSVNDSLVLAVAVLSATTAVCVVFGSSLGRVRPGPLFDMLIDEETDERVIRECFWRPQEQVGALIGVLVLLAIMLLATVGCALLGRVIIGDLPHWIAGAATASLIAFGVVASVRLISCRSVARAMDSTCRDDETKAALTVSQYPVTVTPRIRRSVSVLYKSVRIHDNRQSRRRARVERAFSIPAVLHVATTESTRRSSFPPCSWLSSRDNSNR